MNIFLQISHFDREWNFAPKWVINSKTSHFQNLLHSLHGLENSEFTIITGNQSEDEKICSLVEETGGKITRLDKDEYKSRGLLQQAKKCSSEYLTIISGYKAVINSMGISKAIAQLEESDKKTAYLGAYHRDFPCVINRAHFLEHFEPWTDDIPARHNTSTGMNWLVKNVPPWILPAQIEQMIFRHSPDHRLSIDPSTIGYDESNPGDAFKFKPVISSQRHSTYWNSLKNTNNDDFHELRKRAIQTPFAPSVIQIDFPGDRSLLPGRKLDFDPLSPETYLDTLSSHNQSSLYQTYLKIGLVNDPLSSPSFKTFLNKIDPEEFRLGIYTRIVNKDKEMINVLLAKAHEIFPVLGSFGEETYRDLFEDGDFKTSCGNIEDLVKTKKNNAISLIEKYGQQWIHPLIIPTFLGSSAVVSSGEIQQAFNHFDHWKGFVTDNPDFDRPFENNIYEKFYQQDLPAEQIVIQEINNPYSNNSLDVPDYRPLKRTPCLRMLSSLSIRADGAVFPCDQLMANESFKLGNIQTDSLNDLWVSDKREQMIKKQREGKFEEYELCEGWYQPVL